MTTTQRRLGALAAVIIAAGAEAQSAPPTPAVNIAGADDRPDLLATQRRGEPARHERVDLQIVLD